MCTRESYIGRMVISEHLRSFSTEEYQRQEAGDFGNLTQFKPEDFDEDRQELKKFHT
jgi:hypothetical protein